MDKLAQLISEFGFPVVMAIGMGYFIYFVCNGDIKTYPK